MSRDGEAGYPGNLRVTATYTLNDENEFGIEMTAETDKPTIASFTTHGYWNLGGAGSGKITDHRLSIEAERYLDIDSELIPTGELKSVSNTPFDFREKKPIGRDISLVGDGYDHCFVLNKREEMCLAVEITSSRTGRCMRVMTTQPAVQFYTGNHLNNVIARNGKKFDPHDAFCIEPQNFPDAPNKPHFPNCILRPGQKYTQKTVHRFFTES